MPIENIQNMMAAARQGGYAVGYFESWNLESLQGVLDAAEARRCPMIVGFNGDFLSRSERVAPERLELYAALGRAACEVAKVPCGLIFNECPCDAWVRRAAELGFGLVMPADPDVPLEQYAQRVAELVRHAHARGVAVEAELGELPCGAAGVVDSRHSAMTDPDIAARFVEQTRVDLLAVSVGNVHIAIQGEHGLDLDRLAAIARRVPTPLVLHGGTGIDAASLQAAIKLGVTKVNYGTYLKQRYLAAVRRALAQTQVNPHELLGIGGTQDVMVAGRLAVRDAVFERINLLSCVGRC
ncbi:MAG: class II fructose-bisphosphate aldolase [Phycisphaeraceae bacterium]|nr:class II fructose-bisphosphate aldolase [Phycisphaeraceae bacterium]